MSDQAPILAVSTELPAPFAAVLADTRMFPIIDATWAEALDAVARMQPAAVLVSVTEQDLPTLETLAKRLAAKQPHVPLIVMDPAVALPINAIPYTHVTDNADRLGARLRAALRVRTLHATVNRRLGSDDERRTALHTPDPIEDVTVMLLGRGGPYAALSVAIGERVGVVGALSIEAAAKHLNARELDGIIISDGFSPRVIEAFLTVLAEHSRFRNLPVIVTTDVSPQVELVNLEVVTGDADSIVTTALPLARQHALEARLSRTLTSLDSNGLIDIRSGLLTNDAFERDFAMAVHQTQARGGGLSVVRFTFDAIPERTRMDAARILSKLMRQADFGTVLEDGSIIVAFAETELRSAHMIARRLSSVMKHTMHSARRGTRTDPAVAVTSMLPNDTTRSIIERLREQSERRAAS